jgi:hypothetical protein
VGVVGHLTGPPAAPGAGDVRVLLGRVGDERYQFQRDRQADWWPQCYDDADRCRVCGGEVCSDGGGHAGPECGPGSGFDGFAAVAADPDDDECGEEHPVGGEGQPGRHDGIAVLGDDGAGVAVAGDRGGAADGGQGDDGEEA